MSVRPRPFASKSSARTALRAAAAPHGPYVPRALVRRAGGGGGRRAGGAGKAPGGGMVLEEERPPPPVRGEGRRPPGVARGGPRPPATPEAARGEAKEADGREPA